MAGTKGKSGPPGNNNAAKHGFYAETLSEEEQKLYETAKLATLGDELAVMRLKLHGVLNWMSDPENEIAETTYDRMDRMMARVGDLEIKRSLIAKNERESGANDDSLEQILDRFESSGMVKQVFKPRKNGNGKARNGSG